MRRYPLWRHVLGRPAGDAALVPAEPEERVLRTGSASKGERGIVGHLGSKSTDAQHVLATDDPYDTWPAVEPSTAGVDSSVEPHEGRFLVVTNADAAEDFQLVEAPTDAPGRANWREVVPPRPGTTIKGVDV